MNAHGTRSATTNTWQCYSSGCRRPECRDAWRIYQNARNRAIAYGRISPTRLVDADPARRRIAQLRFLGLGTRAIADLSGVSRSVVAKIAYGQQDLAFQRTVDAIVATRVDTDRLKHRARIEGIGARRRLRALVALGWTYVELGPLCGRHPNALRQIVTAHDCQPVAISTVEFARDLYDRLWNQTPPDTRWSRAARATARARGWAPPLAWDDDQIDNPDAEPAGIRREEVAA